MIRYLFILFQFIFLLIVAGWAINKSQSVSFTFNDLIITTSTSVLIIGLLIIILLTLFFQRVIFFIKQTALKYKIRKERITYEKGYNSFLLGMVALANKDFVKAVAETKKVTKYFKDESLSLLLKSETLKIEKKYDKLNDVYEAMLKNTHTNLLGLRGLMEQNIRAQDFHHAYIYGEKLFNLNPKIDKLYHTLINIIGKTNNWQKLLQINDQALRHRIISKNVYEENQSIALYEIAKIKRHSSENEAMGLMEKALKLRTYFSPFVSYYIQLLIDNNKLSKAKKYLNKAWSNFSHPDLKQEIKLLSKTMKIPYYELAKFITSSSPNTFDSKILLTESLIENENWQEAKQQLSSLLEHKPDREVCLLMAKIEEGDTNDPQKVNSWISRSNFGNISKIWVCRISNVSQSEWSSVSKSGYFNSLDWKYPRNNLEFNSSPLETQAIEYI